MCAETTGNNMATYLLQKNVSITTKLFKKSDDASVDILATNELFYLNILKLHSHHAIIGT
jgi:hypothetical protein